MCWQCTFTEWKIPIARFYVFRERTRYVACLLIWSKYQEILKHHKWLLYNFLRASNLYRWLPFGHHLQIPCHHLLHWPQHWSSNSWHLQIIMKLFHKVRFHYLNIQGYFLKWNHYHLSQIVSQIPSKGNTKSMFRVSSKLFYIV